MIARLLRVCCVSFLTCSALSQELPLGVKAAFKARPIVDLWPLSIGALNESLAVKVLDTMRTRFRPRKFAKNEPRPRYFFTLSIEGQEHDNIRVILSLTDTASQQAREPWLLRWRSPDNPLGIPPKSALVESVTAALSAILQKDFQSITNALMNVPLTEVGVWATGDPAVSRYVIVAGLPFDVYQPFNPSEFGLELRASQEPDDILLIGYSWGSATLTTPGGQTIKGLRIIPRHRLVDRMIEIDSLSLARYSTIKPRLVYLRKLKD